MGLLNEWYSGYLKQTSGREGVNKSIGVSADLNLNKEISEMFLKDWNVVVQVEQSLQKHFYLSTREERDARVQAAPLSKVTINQQDVHQNNVY